MKLYPLPSRADTEAMDTAHRMRAAMAGEDEEEATLAVQTMHSELNKNHELFLAAWSYLQSKERTAWNKYCKKGQENDNRY